MKHLIIFAFALALSTTMAAQNKFMIADTVDTDNYKSTFIVQVDSMSAAQLKEKFTAVLTWLSAASEFPAYKSQILMTYDNTIVFSFVGYSDVTNAQYRFTTTYSFKDNKYKVVYSEPSLDSYPKETNTVANFKELKTYQKNYTKVHIEELEKMMLLIHESMQKLTKMIPDTSDW
jgi:hypothetical protein